MNRFTIHLDLGAWITLASFIFLLSGTHTIQADLDPNKTATVYVHGFSPDGVDDSGVYGLDHDQNNLQEFISFQGVPSVFEAGGENHPNVFGATLYYGDTPPAYYSAQDIADIDAVTLEWGGGIPRYATIVGKYVRNLMQRSGAQQVNLVSASMGTLVARWLIEKDVENLASDGVISRWLSLEGVLAGNWAASDSLARSIVESFSGPSPVDIDHMEYDWVEANLYSPRREADNALLGNILIGQVGTTDDDLNDAALTYWMLLQNEYQPNDGVVGLDDAMFSALSAQSRFQNKMPTTSYFPVTHDGLVDHLPAKAQIATFHTAERRVKVTITRIQVNDINERTELPAEIVFESVVSSPEVANRWGISEPLSTIDISGRHAPVVEFSRDNQEKVVNQIIFDDFVLAFETELRIDLAASEVDADSRYGVFDAVESVNNGSFSDLDYGQLTVSVVSDGTYTFIGSDWNCDIQVEIMDYDLGLGMDFGDAPDPPYLSLFSSNGASHIAIGPKLGSTRDTEEDAHQGKTGLGDDSIDADDEDGVNFRHPLVPGMTSKVDVFASFGGVLNAWIDFNSDGDWQDANEQVFSNVELQGGENILGFTTPRQISPVATHSRFRINVEGDLSPTGPAYNGEVEDYQVDIVSIASACNSAEVKFGAFDLDHTLDCIASAGMQLDAGFNILSSGRLIADTPQFGITGSFSIKAGGQLSVSQ